MRVSHLLLIAALLAACGRDVVEPSDDAVAAVEVIAPTQSVTTGDSVEFVVSVRNAGGQALAAPSVSWSSSDPAVLAVSSAGVGFALAPGFATVTAAVDGVEGSLEVMVVSAAPSVRILALNGTAVEPGRTLEAADSFVVTIRLSVPDTGVTARAVWVVGAADSAWGRSIAAVLVFETPLSGRTVDTTFVGYNAPAGSYFLLPAILPEPSGDFIVGDSVSVSVTNADAASPAIRFVEPTDGQTVTVDSMVLVIELEDPGGIWDYGVTFDWQVLVEQGLLMGPVGQGGSLSPMERFASVRLEMPTPDGMPFQEGENRIIVRARDYAWNVSVDTLTVVYAPGAATAAVTAPAPRSFEMQRCLRELGDGRCMVREDTTGRREFVLVRRTSD